MLVALQEFFSSFYFPLAPMTRFVASNNTNLFLVLVQTSTIAHLHRSRDTSPIPARLSSLVSFPVLLEYLVAPDHGYHIAGHDGPIGFLQVRFHHAGRCFPRAV
jgi:hypothetical protein